MYIHVTMKLSIYYKFVKVKLKSQSVHTMSTVDLLDICVSILLQGNVTFTNRTRELLRIRITQYLENGKEHGVTSCNY